MNTNEREKLQKNGWYYGVVQFFDSREGKRFGFLAGEAIPWEINEVRGGFQHIECEQSWKQEVFFHFNDGCPVVAGSKEVIVRLRKPVAREPRKGDQILFKCLEGRKGPKATPWCYLDEYEKAEATLEAGKGEERFNEENFDHRDFEHSLARLQAAAGWARPGQEEAMLKYILKKSRVTF